MPPNIFLKTDRQRSQLTFPPSDPQVGVFHRTLPHYSPTPLISLPEIAKELGISHLLLKDESSRFGLPAFKILGASWATTQAIRTRLKDELPGKDGGESCSNLELSLGQLGKAAQNADLTLYAATDGSHGRAVSRMAKYLGIKARILVPAMVDEEVIANIRSEGSNVEVCNGDYDQTVLATKRAAEEHPGQKGLLISDTSLEVGDEMAQWIVDGYQTLFDEVEEQITSAVSGKDITHIITPVGSGSLSCSVAKFSRKLTEPTIITVEPETAACLKTSLEAGKSTTIDVGYSICTGLCCGTLSANAWPILKEYVDIAVVVDDLKVHEAVVDLRKYGVYSGPCGAASLSAAKQLTGSGVLNSESILLILCTEGERPYQLRV